MPSTTRYKRGDIVLVSFPFTDLSSSKRPPALVISPDALNDQMEDVVVAALTWALREEKLAGILGEVRQFFSQPIPLLLLLLRLRLTKNSFGSILFLSRR